MTDLMETYRVSPPHIQECVENALDVLTDSLDRYGIRLAKGDASCRAAEALAVYVAESIGGAL